MIPDADERDMLYSGEQPPKKTTTFVLFIIYPFFLILFCLESAFIILQPKMRKVNSEKAKNVLVILKILLIIFFCYFTLLGEGYGIIILLVCLLP